MKLLCLRRVKVRRRFLLSRPHSLSSTLSYSPSLPYSLPLKMLYTRLSLSLLALSASSLVLARDSPSRTDLSRRTFGSSQGSLAVIEKRDVDLEADLEARAVAGLMEDLNAFVERSLIPSAEEHGLEKRTSCSSSTSSSSASSSSSKTSAHTTLAGHFSTCSKAIKTCGSKITAAVKKCGGKKASAASVVVAVKTEIVAIRVALTALAKGCVALKASGKGDLTVSIVAKLVVTLLVVLHTALLEIITLAASLPLLVILLAGELLAIAAELVIALNALFTLCGKTALKAAISASLSANVLAGFRTLGLNAFVSLCV